MNRLNDHLSSYNLLPANQSAYRAHHSTETAVLAIVIDVTRSIDDGHLCALVLLDLSAALDTIDHNIMLETLESRFSVTEEARSWFQSYLTQRNQVYCVGLEVSQPIPLKYGVPQGSVAGPVNFICYTEDVEVVISDFQVRHHLYADDMQLLAKTLPQHLDSCRQELEDCTAAIQDWCWARKLQLNPDKDRINLVRLETSSAENSARKVIHPGMWRPSQSGQLCQESRCPARQPARHEVSYKQYRVGWLLSSSTSSTAAADPESRPSSKASISLDLVED